LIDMSGSEEGIHMPDPPDLAKLQEQVFELVRRSQEAVLDAGRLFSDSLSALAPGDTEAVDKLLDDAFDFTAKVLKTQRDFAKSVVQAVTEPVAGTDAGDSGPSPDEG
jgi:hypothetical protein